MAAGNPVLLWLTSDLEDPYFSSQSVEYGGDSYRWYWNEHCVVLGGYNLEKQSVTLFDPLKGKVEESLEPVSYTHLDVYKRQALCDEDCKKQKKVLATIISRKGSAPRGVGTKMLILEDGTPVSYTHLDVYKRQNLRDRQRAGKGTCEKSRIESL